MKKAHIHLVEMRVQDLVPAPYNPRYMTDKQREGLHNSLSSFGLVEPIVYNKQTSTVVGGHQRLAYLVEQGVELTDVSVVDLGIEQEKALNVALNHTGISGQFDEDKLNEVLAELSDDLKVSLNLDELEIPTFAVLPDIGDSEIKPPTPKITITVKEAYQLEEMKELITRVMNEHFEGTAFEIK